VPNRMSFAVASLSSLTAVCALACAPSTQLFLDRQHRADYALELEELERAQFYVSDEIVAQELGPAGLLEGRDHVFVVARGTPGVVTDAGPHWLRVSFGLGPGGVLFLAKSAANVDSVYALASDAGAGQPPMRVQDLSDRTLSVAGRRFRVISGADARLLIADADLDHLIEARRHAPGRAP